MKKNKLTKKKNTNKLTDWELELCCKAVSFMRNFCQKSDMSCEIDNTSRHIDQVYQLGMELDVLLSKLIDIENIN